MSTHVAEHADSVLQRIADASIWVLFRITKVKS